MTRNLWSPPGASLTGIPCPKHELPMLITRSGLQHVCVIPDCDQHVRLQGPHREDRAVTKEERKREIDEFVKRKQEEKKSDVQGVTPGKKPTTKIPAELNATSGKSKKQLRRENEERRAAEGHDDEVDEVVRAPKKKDPKKDPSMLSVSQIAQELGLDPKRARAKLRAAGQSATEGRWSLVKRDSKEHKQLVALLSAGKPKAAKVADDEEEDEE